MGKVNKLFLLPVLFFGLVHCSDFQGIFAERGTTSQYPAAPAHSKVTAPRETTGRSKPINLNKMAKEQGQLLPNEIRASIETHEGVYYFVRPGDTLAQISKHYGIGWEDIAQINGLYDSDLVVGRRLFIPYRKTLSQYVTVSKVISQDRTPSHSTNKKINFIWPIEDVRITSVYGHPKGRSHPGVDIGSKVGTPVWAAEEGRVIYADRFTTYGNLVVIKHDGDYFTAYAHNSKVLVRKGQPVKKGQKISLVGSTGHSTGPHLHFEIRHKMDTVDPLTLLPPKNDVKTSTGED